MTEEKRNEILDNFKITHEEIDIPICDVYKSRGIEDVKNDQTFREFIRASEDDFEMHSRDIDNMNFDDMNDYLEFLDELWSK